MFLPPVKGVWLSLKKKVKGNSKGCRIFEQDLDKNQRKPEVQISNYALSTSHV
jgi:hypothetical protein